MSNTATSSVTLSVAPFAINSECASPYPSAYGALRGGLETRCFDISYVLTSMDSTDSRVAEIRFLLNRMMETLTSVESAVNEHNRIRDAQLTQLISKLEL